jgi:uncharacterized iron-regulated membrane protein
LVWAGATGIALAFYKEIDRALNPALHFVAERAQSPLATNVLASRIEAVYPDALINVMMLDRQPGESVRVRLSRSVAASAVDPADGNPAMQA